MNSTLQFPTRSSRRRLHLFGFTLVELLTVIAVLAILAAILVPVVGRAQDAARRTRVRTQFAQWAAGLEAFRTEYGFYPDFAASPSVPASDACRVNEVPGLFVQTLTGRRGDGAVADLPRALAANPRRIAFLVFAADELGTEVNPAVRDACGNTDIVVLVDRDGDGLVRVTGTLPAVVSAQTGHTLVPPADAIPAGGVRGTVLFYSAGPARSTDDLIFSWR